MEDTKYILRWRDVDGHRYSASAVGYINAKALHNALLDAKRKRVAVCEVFDMEATNIKPAKERK